MSEARREADKIWELVRAMVIPRERAVEWITNLFTLALPDPIVVDRKTGRIKFQGEELMSTTRDEISMQDMKDFWAATQKAALAQNQVGQSNAQAAAARDLNCAQNFRALQQDAAENAARLNAVAPRSPKAGETWGKGSDIAQVTFEVARVSMVCNKHKKIKDLSMETGTAIHHAVCGNCWADNGWTYVNGPAITCPICRRTFVSPTDENRHRGTCAEPVPAPRAHDFSNPYLVTSGKERLCVTCGNTWLHVQCEPRPNWRDEHELTIKIETEYLETKAIIEYLETKAIIKPQAAAYRNDVAGIGARLGGYLNVAPERGR